MKRSKQPIKIGNRSVLSQQDYDYENKLSDSERAWLYKFNQEYYGHNFGNDPVHKVTPEIKTEAYERENAARRDVWNTGEIEHLATIPDALLSDVSHVDLDWEEIYKRAGYEKAMEKIVDDTLDDLENSNVNKATTLHRFHSKAGKLRKMHEADRRNNGKDEGNDE